MKTCRPMPDASWQEPQTKSLAGVAAKISAVPVYPFPERG